MNRLDRVAIASRAFCIAAILGLTASTGSIFAIQNVILLGAIAGAAGAVTLVTPLPPAVVAAVEAFVVGLIIGTAIPAASPLLPYLAIPALIAGMSRGILAVIAVIAAEVVALVGITLLTPGIALLQRYELVAPWLLTSLGVGLLGTLVRQMGALPGTSPVDESYESARRLLAQLRTVARRLSAGLDPVSMADQVLTVVHERLGDTRSALFVRTEGGVLAPLGYRGDRAQEGLNPDDLVDACWAEMEPTQSFMASGRSGLRHRVVLPLRSGSRMIGVVLSDAGTPPAKDSLTALMRRLDEHSLRLDTALAFDEVRSIATAEERSRLAREIHDGVAQEIASLGYAVDELAATALDASQRESLLRLRQELTRVVSELRLSIFDLRSGVNPTAGIGSALSAYVRQVGSRSNMTVHLTLDESPTRLRAEVETELLRMSQEAITNARKHSGAKNLWVDCRVEPPFVRIQIRDDGRGLSQGRDDSYGLQIMRERAERIGATLQIDRPDGNDGNGTLVSVTVGADPLAAAHNLEG